jgi:hypothetical protein
MKFYLALLRVTRILQWLSFIVMLIFMIMGRTTNLFLDLFFFCCLIDPITWTSLYQLFGILYAVTKFRGKFPSFENYSTKNKYILPFCDKWAVINGGVDKALSHSWDIPSQRYAYDFIILDDEGKSYNGDPTKVENFYCYGKDIIAPADGVIVKACDKHYNSRVNRKRAYCDATDLRGNHIIIKHDNNEYSLIAHLAPGSVTVKIGDKVKQGDKIAKCGNSGNTSEPHVHFQIQTGKDFFLSASLPIGFKNIEAAMKTKFIIRVKKDAIIHDNRPTDGNLRERDGLTYIGRGLEVNNEEVAYG